VLRLINTLIERFAAGIADNFCENVDLVNENRAQRERQEALLQRKNRFCSLKA